MKSLIFLFLPFISVNAFANQDKDIFYAEILSIECDGVRKVDTLDGTCLITFRNSESDQGEIIGLVIHEEMYWDGGKFIQVGSLARVDLSYTVNRTQDLKALFPKTTQRVYFHDIDASYGSYRDVIELIRRD